MNAVTSPAAAGTSAPLDVARVRRDFPVLTRMVNGRPLAYLDNAASSQRPQSVIDAVSRYYETSHANVHRGVHTLSQEATDLFEGGRRRVRHFVNARSSREIVFMRGTTEAINLVAHSWGAAAAGDEMLITHLEHHSNIVPWQMACELRVRGCVVMPLTDAVRSTSPGLRTDRTRLVALAHVSNALGTVLPVQRFIALRRRARHPGAARRRAGDRPPQGRRAAAGLRFLLLLRAQGVRADRHRRAVRSRVAPASDATLARWRRHDPHRRLDGSTYNELPYKFEAGTPNISGAVGLGAALEYLDLLGRERVAAHEQLLDARHGAPARDPRSSRWSGPRPTSPASFHSRSRASIRTTSAPFSTRQGVAVRSGHHCAMPVMSSSGCRRQCVPRSACYNTHADIDQLVAAAGQGARGSSRDGRP